MESFIVRLGKMAPFFFCLAFTMTSAAQTGTFHIHPPHPPDFFPIPPSNIIFLPPPVLKVPAHEQPIELQDMSVKVAISGLETETTTLLTFHNPNGRILEGELEFPLPNDATVTGYALDINGKMIDGVIVGKEKARVVLETEIRRGVDPGIVEHVKGNIFRTRVYPIPSTGTRVVKIVSVSPLTLSGQDAAMQISLPIGQKIANLSIEVQVGQGDPKPQIGGFGNLTFTDWQDQWVAKTKLINVTPDNDIFLNLPKLPDQLKTIEKFGDETFFSVSDRLNSAVNAVTKQPQRLMVAWDASGSRRPDSVKKDRDFLVALFQKWKNINGQLIVFRNRVESPIPFQVNNGKADELFSALDQLAYDGGTRFSELNLTKTGKEDSVCLLFTDGLVTLGENLPKFGGTPVHVISSDTVRDSALQQFLANVTGGTFVDLTSTPATQAADLVTQPKVSLLRVEAPAGALELVQTQFVASANRAAVTARLKSDTILTLVYGVGGVETQRKTIELKLSSAKANHLVARSWAAARSKELGVFADKNEAELVTLGQKYSLVTPGTSLIVLERVSQYLEHEIVPPDSMPEWREQYFAGLKGRQQQQKSAETSKIEQVVAWWKARVAWWEKDFPKTASLGSSVKGGTVANFGASGAANEMAREAAPAVAEGQADMAAPPPSEAMSMAAPSPGVGRVGGGGSAKAKKSMAAGHTSESKEDAENEVSQSAQITIKEWSPSTPYLESIRSKAKGEAYAAYLHEKTAFGQSPGFYLDCANFFFKQDRDLALRILSNLAELKIEDAALLRVLAWRLSEAGELDTGIEVLEKVRRLRPEEPQSHRDLALALAQRLEKTKVSADGVRAAELFYQVILGHWDRFAEVETIVVMELNHLLMRMEKLTPSAKSQVKFVDSRLRKLLDLDVRITMSWDADNTDMDLHVIEPSGEEAFYGHQLTSVGGLVSRDITNGYGPEEYVIHHALPGTYQIRAKYFGSRQQTLMGPVTVTANVITNYGRKDEKHQLLTLRLSEAKDMVDIGAIAFGKAGAESAPRVSALKLSDLKKLQKGMDEKAVIAALGEPERQDGGALSVFVYRLTDGTQVRVGFGPNLLWIQQIVSGAVLQVF